MDIELEHVQVIRPLPGDVIVYNTEARLSAGRVAQITQQLRQLFPDNLIGILDAGARLVIVRADEEG